MGKTYVVAGSGNNGEAVMRLYGTIGSKVDGDYFAQELAALDTAGYDIINIRLNLLAAMSSRA